MDCRAKFYSSAVFFRGKVVVFLARSYFSGIFQIFKGLFELDLLL